MRLKLRWGPSDAEALQGSYVEIWLEPNKIWTSSPAMYQPLLLIEADSEYYMLQNQHLKLHTVETTVTSAYLLSVGDLEYRVMLQNNFRHDHHARKVEIQVTLEPGNTRFSGPLHTELP